MNRGIRTVIVVIVAVTAASLASAGVYQAVRRMPVREVEVPAAFIVAAAAPLPMGVRLTSSQVKLVAWPARSPVKGTFTTLDAVVGRGLVAPVGENEPITESKLAPTASGAGLPPAITPGMRAMSVKVNEVIGVAGFVVPGARVDVLVTIHDNRASTARAVASDVQVLAAGTRTDQTDPGKGKPATVVTLMVSPVDAERIALAATEGQIMLALRNPLDTAQTQTSGATTSDLTATPPATPAPAPPAPRVARVKASPAPVTVAYTFETIRAGKREKEMVR